ncbi:DUF4465 domain-containing protein [Stieleria sp. TO1_6]|uniref:DUF4465 domain-containing protein n=1 Tax=Stieleria tagensis TaxID=2956795 RepID=UPI00209B495E|nr:DUF4465 domain-containing protein [Stieleria tagensis]MCO8123014.1 DUF4465 domain-containing protein [Stieleria tagensis]
MKLMQPRRPSSLIFLSSVIVMAMSVTTHADSIVDFESFSLDSTGVFDGPAANAVEETRHYWWGSQQEQVGTFAVDGVGFSNSSSDFSWGGFAVSNHTDSLTPGFGNQYSAIAGSGALGSSNYGVAFGYRDTQTTPVIGPSLVLDPTDANQLRQLPSLYLPANTVARSAMVTNTTYTGLSMRDGDGFAKQFGGAGGTDPDFLKLTVYGVDASDQVLGTTVDFLLADFRFADSADDYIVDDWTTLDFGSLAGARSLHFNLESSDTSDYGMNTPSYFALDNLTITAVPEPSCMALMASIGTMFVWQRRRRS